jgi:hypothetical protein
MVLSQESIRRIREVVDKHYNKLIISVLGSSVLSKEEIKELKDQGIDVDNDMSMMELVYNHNFMNPSLKEGGPTSVQDMIIQQRVPGATPVGEAHSYTIESLNDVTKQYIEKIKMSSSTRIEGIIKKNNDEYKMNALQNLERPEMADRLVKESSLGKVKQMLRDTSGDANRDWQRVAITEMGNAIGIGSVDRIVSDNKNKNLNDVYVYRIPVNDEKTCKYCRRFYNSDKSGYKIYRLSTLLGNGTNYGKKTDAWQPVIGSTHPNSRTSQIIEIPPGWAIDGGRLTFIGLDKWDEYIRENLVA